MGQEVYFITLVGTALVLLAAFSSLIALRVGTPLLLLFLLIGLVTGTDGLGIQFDNAPVAYFVGSLALAVILFESGFGTPISSFRQAAAPALVLATVGVVLTTVVLAAIAWLVTGFTWLESLLLAAALASTDAAAVFFLLRAGNLHIRDRVRSTLEIESGSNDPIAIFLTLTLVSVMSLGATPGPGTLLGEIIAGFLVQLGLGAAAGLIGGLAITRFVRVLALDAGLMPIFVLALALLVFAAAGAVGGSGFLAVYVAGLVAGNLRLRGAAALTRFQNGVSWLSQIIMFLVLGLFATPSQFAQLLPVAIVLGVALIIVARPVAVGLCLLPFRYQPAEITFIAWVGLRGAVSILLAITPLLGGLAHGRDIFNIAFLIVLVSLLVQGWTIGPLARRLGLAVPARIGPLEKVELELPGAAHHELLAYTVVAGSPVERGVRIPRWARPSLVVRGGRSMKYQDAGRLLAGDHVYIFVADRYPRLLDRLFASPTEVDPEDPDFFGTFSLSPDQPAAEIEAAYGAVIRPEERELSIAELMAGRLAGKPEYADRVPLGPVELIARDVDEAGRIVSVGLSIEPDPTRRQLPRLLLPGEMRRRIAALARYTVSRRAARAALGDPPPAQDVATAPSALHPPAPPLQPHTAERQRAADKMAGQDKQAGRNPGPVESHSALMSGRDQEGTPAMPKFSTLDDLDPRGRRVLLRVDLNVPMEQGAVADTTRIERVLPTITEIAGKGGRVVLLAHFDRPKGRPVPEMSLRPVGAALSRLLGRPVAFAADCIGETAAAAIAALGDGDVLLLENTRFHAGEEKNDPEFARALAANGDVYVNDAFSAAHRAHASTEGLARLLPAYAGRAMQAELEALEKGLGSPRRPVIAIVGGAKVSTKIDLLENLVARVDALVIGGGMANTFLFAQGLGVGKSLCEKDLADTARRIMEKAKTASCAVILPVDAVVAWHFEADAPHQIYGVDAIPEDGMILDAGPQSLERIRAAIEDAATLVWNGPLGAFELKPFDQATVAAAQLAARLTGDGKLVSVAGGGDTVAALNQAGVAGDFTYVSTAGGAFLEWMEGKELPGVAALARG